MMDVRHPANFLFSSQHLLPFLIFEPLNAEPLNLVTDT